MTPAPKPFAVLILAGRRSAESDPLAGVDGAKHKALLIAGGKPLIARVVDALAEIENIGSVRITAPEDLVASFTEALTGRTGFEFIPPSSSPAATILAALDAPWSVDGLLVTTCDHALLTPEIVRAFLAESRQERAAAACVEQSVYEARFPGSRRTFVKLKDFTFSGANLFWFAGPEARGLAAFWRGLEQKRKKPVSMAKEIGIGTAIAYLTGNLSKAGLEKLIRKRTGVTAKLVSLPMAQAAIDVDKPQDLDLVRKILNEGAA